MNEKNQTDNTAGIRRKPSVAMLALIVAGEVEGWRELYEDLDKGLVAFKEGDYDTALTALKSWVEQNRGDRIAEYFLGEMYREGLGTKRDLEEATKWYRLSGDELPEAQLRLGQMYYSGLGVPVDYEESANWLRLAADQDNPDAQSLLALMCLNGEGLPKDDSEAAKWFLRAGEQGEISSQYNSGVAYNFGLGLPQNYHEAAKWYQLAADQGHADAQFNLGVLRMNGHGGARDCREAERLFLSSAEQGNPRAQHNLGVLYFGGKGIPPDNISGYKWLTIALANKNLSQEQPEMIDYLRSQFAQIMTTEQIDQSENLARDWLAK